VQTGKKSIAILVGCMLTSMCFAFESGEVDALVYPRTTPLMITVGDESADIPGFTCRAIQLALDAVHIKGGGTVKLTPGLFTVKAPVSLYSNTTLEGSGKDTILRKVDGIRTNFIDDADYGELKLLVKDVDGFLPGMGVQVYDAEQMRECWNVTTAKITAIEGNTIYIDTYLIRDYRADRDGVISNACSVIAAVQADNVRIADLCVDGNKDSNEMVNGCVGGAIYFHKMKNALVENVLVKDWNGDGISWQITEEVTVRNCEITGCSNFGMHPGTGSPNSVIEGNNSHHNEEDGLYICWRVRDSLVRNNVLHHNGRYGICTGHKDTNILFENNHIYENASDGVNLRRERASNAPHQSVFHNNLVENNGTAKGGYGFSFRSPAKDVVLENNTIRDTGGGTQKTGVYIYETALPITLRNNTMSGHTEGDVISELDR
jgi:hypothetical protein